MRFNLDLFDAVFPNYYDFKVPMWSETLENNKGLSLDVVIPGYDKEDFSLYEEGGRVFLSINRGENASPWIYNVLDREESRGYDLEKIDAKYKAGVLKITIPKAAVKSEQRKIGIS